MNTFDCTKTPCDCKTPCNPDNLKWKSDEPEKQSSTEEAIDIYKIGLIEQLKVLKLFRALSPDAITAINECISIVEKYVPHDKP